MQPIGQVIDGDQTTEPKSVDAGGPTGNGSEIGTGGNSNPEVIAGYESVDPHGIERTESESGRKRRGRPPGSRNRVTGIGSAGTSAATEKTPQDLKESLERLEAVLLSVHFMGAKLLSTPELELDEIEAKKLSDSMKNVAKHYPNIVNSKQLAWIELSTTLGGIYGPRAIAIWKRGDKKPKPIVEMPKPKTEPAAEKVTGGVALSPSQIWFEDGGNGGF